MGAPGKDGPIETSFCHCSYNPLRITNTNILDKIARKCSFNRQKKKNKYSNEPLYERYWKTWTYTQTICHRRQNLLQTLHTKLGTIPLENGVKNLQHFEYREVQLYELYRKTPSKRGPIQKMFCHLKYNLGATGSYRYQYRGYRTTCIYTDNVLPPKAESFANSKYKIWTHSVGKWV